MCSMSTGHESRRDPRAATCIIGDTSLSISRRICNAGKNVLAAVVWNFGADAPLAQVTNETGFLLKGDTAAEHVADTGEGSGNVSQDDGVLADSRPHGPGCRRLLCRRVRASASMALSIRGAGENPRFRRLGVERTRNHSGQAAPAKLATRIASG